MRKTRLNKKGFANPISETLMALLVMLVGLLFMTLLTNHVEKERKDMGVELLKEAKMNGLFALYLKQPVIVDGNEMSISDLIILADMNGISSSDNVYVEALKKESRNFFSQYSAADIGDLSIFVNDVVVYNILYQNSVTKEFITYLPGRDGKIIPVKIVYLKSSATKRGGK